MIKFQIESDHAGQRIDNFLKTALKGVPKSRIYRGIRQGQIKVNQKKVKPDYRLQCDDHIQVPTFRVAEAKKPAAISQSLADNLQSRILFEDDQLLIINKPTGLPVHGGSGVFCGLIEALRILRPRLKTLELVHRLDKGTSGFLILAKKRATLIELHQLLALRKLKKTYLALVKGIWQQKQRVVDFPLLKQVLKSGERMVVVNQQGKPALTVFHLIKQYKNFALVKIEPKTGRTHQIRVHAAAIGYPILGDEKYGDKNFNKQIKSCSDHRLFLHSVSLNVKGVDVCALPDAQWYYFIERFDKH